MLEVVALAISPGPKRGAKLMTRSGWIVLALATALAGLATSELPFLVLGSSASVVFANVSMAVIAAATAIAIALAVPPPISPRLLLLLAIPAYPAVIASTWIGA